MLAMIYCLGKASSKKILRSPEIFVFIFQTSRKWHKNNQEENFDGIEKKNLLKGSFGYYGRKKWHPLSQNGAILVITEA